MLIFAGRSALVVLVAALGLGGWTANAQTAPVAYWIPSWPIGFGGGLTAGESANAYGNFPGFDGGGAHQGGGLSRYNFSNGWFVGGESSGNQFGGFGNLSSLHYEGVQFGYNFKATSGLPVTVYAGFDTPKYNPGIGGTGIGGAGIGGLAPFDAMSSTLPGYSAHAGVAFQPAPNVSLSLGASFTQQSGDINSLLLPGASPLGFGGGPR